MSQLIKFPTLPLQVLLIFSFFFVGCGSPDPGAVVPSDPVACGDPGMLTLNDNFKAALQQQPNTPSFIAKLVQSEQYAEVTSQTDWLAALWSENVDLTTEPGSVMIPKVTPGGITQTAYNSTLCFGSVSAPATQSPAVPGTDSFSWQSFKQNSGKDRYVNRVPVFLSATGSNIFWNYFYIQLFDAKNGTAISTLKTIGGSGYTVDSLVEVDFSSENILMTTGTTYWLKIYGMSQALHIVNLHGAAACYVRYHSTTTTYTDGQMDGKPYSGAESVNCGDMAFKVTFLNTYVGTALTAHQLDLGSVPTVDGEVRIDALTPLDSSLAIRLYSLPDKTDLVESTISDTTNLLYAWTNGRRLFRVKATTPYLQYSDNRGDSWSDIPNAFPTTVCGTMASYGGVIVATRPGSFQTAIYVSYDAGMSWVTQNVATSGYWYAMYAGGKFFLVNQDQSSSVYHWADNKLSSWTQGAFASAAYWRNISWNGTIYICTPGPAQGATTGYMTSTNGTSWSAATLPSSNTWGFSDWISHAGLFYVTAGGGGLTSLYYTSATGATGSWTSRNFPGTIYEPIIKTNGIIALALGSNPSGTYTGAYSANLTSWTANNTFACRQWQGWCPLDCGFYGAADATYARRWFPTNTAYIGDVSDGTVLTDKNRYLFFTAFLSPNSTGSWTPILRSVQTYFPTWVVFSSTPEKGYEPALTSVSSLQTAIDTFKPSTVGQVSLGIALTKQVSNWLKTAYPRNKEVRIYAGFSTLAEADYISYYRGNVEDWSFGQNRQVSISLRDFSKTWKGVPVPGTWQTTADDKTWTAQHPVDVMLDILQGNIGAPTKAIDGSSFGSVKAALSDWVVTNKLTGKTFDAKDLLEELRFITGTYFIPQYDGRIKLKRWDKNEAAVMSLSDDEMIGVAYKGNSASLMNLLNWYFNMDTEGVGKSGGIALHQELDGASGFNWGEQKVFEFKDYWTLTAGDIAQIQPVASDMLERYAAVPDILAFQLDLRFIELECADMVNITTKIAPSTDLAGISNVKYQITRKDLDFIKNQIKLEVLRAA